MWQVEGESIPQDWLVLDPVHVLYEFDGPRIFTCKSNAGDVFLAYLSDEEANVMRFVVVPFSAELEAMLTSGRLTVRQALDRNPAWIFDVGYDWRARRAWSIDINKLPTDALPIPGVMLWPHLQSGSDGTGILNTDAKSNVIRG